MKNYLEKDIQILSIIELEIIRKFYRINFKVSDQFMKCII